MEIPCKVKKVGGSRYIVINTIVLESLNLLERDIVLVDFIKKMPEIESNEVLLHGRD